MRHVFTKWQCPECGEPAVLAVGRLVYPRTQEWWSRTVLICWGCNTVRRRGEAWSEIDLPRHNREWGLERKQQRGFK